MEKKIVIQKAREFAQRSLKGNIKNVNREDYYMFLVSKFLLLKEMIIKKDSENNILYFNYNKSKEYLPAIKYIVDYIKVNGTIQKNSTTVIIEPNQYNNSNLQFYIWTFNKIRDSLAHGMYEFDLNKSQLIIKNAHSNSRDPYVLNCALPIEMFELFTYIAKKPKSKYSDKEITEFKGHSKKMRADFGYVYDEDDKIIKNYNKYNHINYDTYNISNINNNMYNISNINNNSYNYDNLKINLNTYEYSKEQEDVLDALLVIIKNSDKLTDEQRKILYTYLRKLGLLDFNIEIDKTKIKRNKHPDKKYTEKLATVISEISSILGIKNKPNNMITMSAIYNYMQLTFSLNEFNFKSREGKESLGYLRISKIHPMYVKSNNNKFDENVDSQYSLKINAIRNFTTNFVVRMKEKIQQYKGNPSSSFRQSINDLFKKYYEDIIQSFSDKNAFVLTSIRNSIEHANIHNVSGQIMLNDQSNQNDNHSINFCCYGNADDFFEITNSLESETAKEKFTFGDFLDELKSIIDSSSFNEVLSIVNELKVINAEALVNVLNQSISR